MMNEWKEVILNEIIDFKNGKKKPTDGGCIPVYGGNGVLGFCKEYNNENVVAIGRVGAYCGSVYLEKQKCWVSDNAIAAKAKSNSIVEYIYYLLVFLRLNERRIGTGQPLLTQEILNSISCSVPKIDEQKAIADTLSCLDDKIELNNKINKNLEAQAQAIFKSWFVDFEPFQDGEFVDSELGRIPKGWRVGTLGEVADIQMGQSPKGISYNEDKIGTVFYQGRTDFGIRYPKVRLYTTDPKRMANKNDILLSVRAPVGDINIAGEICCIGRGLASLKSKIKCNSFVFYYLLILRDKFDIYNGEGTVFGSINKDALNNIKIIVPQGKIIFDFQTIVESIDSCIQINSKEAQTLTTLRDTLLPKLMSGEIRVPPSQSIRD